MKKEVAVVEQVTSLAVVNEAMFADGEAGMGFETVTSKNMAIPFIKLLQALSPQVKKGGSKIEGAEVGMFYNTVTQEVYGTQIRIVPCAFREQFIEWRPDNGGLEKIHSSSKVLEECTRDEKFRYILPNKNEIVQTALHYCVVVLPDGGMCRCVVSLTKTQLKNSRKWISLMQSQQLRKADGSVVTPSSFSYSYLAEAKTEEKNTNSWEAWVFGTPLLVTPDVYQFCRKFYQEVNAGGVEVNYEQAQEPATSNEPVTSEHF